MLTEQFIASVGTPSKPAGTNIGKDAAIFIHEYQPLSAQRAIFKKSATPPNCLAVSESHIYAAQTEKAVVHVYNREKGNQEAIVPFTERITCLALACNESVLILGTAEGRIFLWEVASGRQISTARSHLQTVSVLAVDATSNFLLSASLDSTVHVWSIPSLLSFATAGVEPLTPLRSFGSHRSKVNALTIGNSSSFCNIAISASQDRTCLVWEYHTNTLLMTYLLPSIPTCLALDAAQRAVYVGQQDGNIIRLDLFASRERETQSLRSPANATTPIQPPKSSQWTISEPSAGAVHCLSISFDGTNVISGHESGAVFVWDISRNGFATSLLQSLLPGPVTNLFFLPVLGLTQSTERRTKISSIVKPKFGAFNSSTGLVPRHYLLAAELTDDMYSTPASQFQRALSAPSFPPSLMDSGMDELMSHGKHAFAVEASVPNGEEDFMSLDDQADQPRQLSVEEQNASLKAELEALRRVQKASFEKMEKMIAEKKALTKLEQRRLANLNSSGVNGTSNLVHAAGHSSDEDDD